MLLITSLLALVLAFGVGHQLDRPSDAAHQLQRLARRMSTSFTVFTASIETAVGKNPSKYKTTLVHVEPRHVATVDACADANYHPTMLLDSRIVDVTDAMEGPSLANTDKVFFMLNGQNEGLYVSWNKDFSCVGKAASAAVVWLGADTDEVLNGVRLYTQMGFPIRNMQELTASGHLVHILVDFQIWQWPGIKKGHKYVLENGVTLTTVGISPKVLDVEFFLTQAEADKIRELGEPTLNRSKVDGSNSSTVVSKARTSHTAFLPDGAFTRDFRRRSAMVTRLPSPSYAERLQLVRYGAGEFYRQHLDTFHSREFLPKNAGLLSLDDYKAWCEYAAEQLRKPEFQSRIPEDFQEGGKLFPVPDDELTFPNAFLALFLKDAVASNFFVAEQDREWEKWLRENLEKNARNILQGLMKADGKPHYLTRVIRSWEKQLGIPEIRYSFPKKALNGVTHFFRWVRWAKERITFLGDQVPAIARHDGALFPKFEVGFQTKLLDFVLDDYSSGLLAHVTNDDWYKWLMENRGRTHVLFKALQQFPHLAELTIRSWESRVHAGPELHYTMPKWVRHFHPQRYVTLFLYLNNETKIGGETVFPNSLDRYGDETIERTGMSECSQGLAVPPRGLHASLFYVQTYEGEADKMSRHGGCPPHEGVKWGANSFMWDSDADEGADLWTTK